MTERACKGTRNEQVDWNWDPTTYVQSNYGEEVIPADRRLARATLGMLQEHEAKFGTFTRGLHIGIGNVPIESAYAAPFMNRGDEETSIVMGDIGAIKLEATRRTIASLKRGELGIWRAHQKGLSHVNPAWDDAFQTAGELGRVVELNMYDLTNHKEEFEIGVAGHVFESATEDRREYEETKNIFYKSVATGGLVIMSFMARSAGYQVDGDDYPAYSVDADEIIDHAEELLTDIQMYTTAAAGHAREPGDPHSYRGMGVMVAVRK